MRVTFFHWGFHAWAIYTVVGLALAYFAYRHNLPLKIRSALYPMIGQKIYGPIGGYSRYLCHDWNSFRCRYHLGFWGDAN